MATDTPNSRDEGPRARAARTSSSALLKTTRAKASTLLRLAPFVTPSNARIAYVGAGRSTNLGDLCMLQAYRLLLPGMQLAVAPHGDLRRRMRLLKAFTPGQTICAIALGGGTLIGSRTYRERLEMLLEVFPDVPVFMLGTGVEDPEPVDGRAMTSVAELKSWAPVLERATAVHVRGPRSAEILSMVGIPSEVIGDSALALGDARPTITPEPRLLGVNIGLSQPIWGGDPAQVLREIVIAGRSLVSKGWRIRLLPVWPPDLEYTRSAAAAIGRSVEIREHFGDTDSYLDALRQCDVFVGEKLHSVVLATAVFVPSLMLEYRPKCLDFQRSLGPASHTIRTGSFVAQDVVAKVEELSLDRERQQAALIEAVGRLRARLRSAGQARLRDLSGSEAIAE